MTSRDPRPRLEQVDLLYRNAPAGIAAGVVIALFAYFLLREARMPQAQAWLAASLAVSASRAWLVIAYRRRPPATEPALWLRRHAWGAFAAGATWGALGIGFFPQAPAEIQIGIVLIVAGMSAGAIAVFAVSATAFAAFMLPALLPLIATLAVMERPLFHAVAVMGAIFIAASLAAARNTARALNEAIALRFEHEDALRRVAAGELHLRMLGENVPAYIAHFDGEERLRHCNTAYAALFGEQPGALLGRHARDILGAERYDSQAAAARRALGGEIQRYRTARTLPGGAELVLDAHRAPFRGEDGAIEGYYVFATDVTELNRLERLKGEFVSTVSHELRTPLTSIRGSLGIIAAGGVGSLGDDAAELVAIARKNCERLTRLIDDLLDFDKIEAGRMQFDTRPADLMSLVDEAVRQNAGYAAEHGVTLRATDRVAGARVAVDALRFGQLMANLISNAAKYSPRGEAVEIGVRAREGAYRVSVRDHGPGIDPAFRSRIFQRFSQGDSSDARRVGGTGLGLAIARSIVERFGGAIDFDSTPGRGATFHFDLPAVEVHG